ncbi:uncharacterized protein LOC131151530 [Malania oleifera]|uniref:uncharacterized protein LOC131151530 n=1 Tax=Malania oleifera TaxID=397392 RepID=UPI0025AEB87C|nr:uncharacterized protein LOC131151530 [Malania oleifera]
MALLSALTLSILSSSDLLSALTLSILSSPLDLWSAATLRPTTRLSALTLSILSSLALLSALTLSIVSTSALLWCVATCCAIVGAILEILERFSFSILDHERYDHGLAYPDSDSKRRKQDSSGADIIPLVKPNREPRVVVQIVSEVDILDDGYCWCKYGQKW